MLTLSFVSCANSTGGTQLPDKGIQLTLDMPNGTSGTWIYRRNVTAGIPKNDNEGFQEYVGYWESSNISLFTDYFVEPDNTYQYYVKYWGQEGFLKQSKIITKKAKDGYGELKITNKPRAIYDQTSGIMTCTSIPSLTSSQASFCNYKNANVNTKLKYVLDDTNVNDSLFLTMGPKINVANNIGSEKLYDQNLSFNFAFTDIQFKDGFNFRKYYNKTDLSEVVQKITVKDNRFEITGSSSKESKGIKINIPADAMIPNSMITIGRSTGDVSNANNGDMKYWYITVYNSNQLKDKNSITDYFVDNGKTYTYKLYVRDPSNNGKILKESKPFILTAASGVGCGLSKETTIIKNSNGQIDRIEPFTAFPEEITNGARSYDFGLFFYAENSRIYAGIEKDGTIRPEKNIPDSAKLITYMANFQKDGVRYGTVITSNEGNTLYPKLFTTK